MENQKEKKVITLTMMAKFFAIVAFVVYVACWIIVSIREGELIPDFVRENWWAAVLFILLPFVNIFIPKEKQQERA